MRRLMRLAAWLVAWAAVVSFVPHGHWASLGWLLVPFWPLVRQYRDGEALHLTRVQKLLAVGLLVTGYVALVTRIPGGQWINLLWVAFPLFALRRLDGPGWVRLIWAWWAFCFLFMVTLAVVAMGQSLAIDVQEKTDQLSVLLDRGLRQLQVHQFELLEADGALVVDGVRFVRGAPGQPFLPGEPKPWYPIERASRFTNLKWYTTRAPQASLSNEDGFLVAEGEDGTRVAVTLNDVYGAWLTHLCQKAGWDALVSVKRVPVQQKRLSVSDGPTRFEWQLGVGAVGQHGWGLSNHWYTQFNTFTSPGAVPLDRIELTVRGDDTTWAVLRRHVGWIEAGLTMMVFFASTLVLTERGIRRQLELSQSRQSFAAMVSHELRTPVAALRLHTDMLEHHLVEEPHELEECYRVLGDQTRRLQTLIETVLDLARLERQARPFNLEQADVNQVVRDAVANLRAGGDAEVGLVLAAGVPLAWVDREAAVQVLVNLIQNGLKYARDVSVATSADRRWVRVQVLDRGPGIPKALRARIFEPYVRAGTGGKGVGLGLSLVRGYMEGMRGTVSVAARPGGGTVFTVQFRR